MLLTKFACPSCGTVLKSAAGLEAGKSVVCPNCKERFAASASGPAKEPPPEDEEDAERIQASRSPARAGAKGATPTADDETQPADEEDAEREEPVRKKKGQKKARRQEASSWLTPSVIGGGLLLVFVGLGIAVFIAFRKTPEPDPPPVAVKPPDNTTAVQTPSKSKPLRREPRTIEEMTERVIGRWEGVTLARANLSYDYRSDGTFTIKVENAGKDDGARIRNMEGDQDWETW